jgi:hypothetical protein
VIGYQVCNKTPLIPIEKLRKFKRALPKNMTHLPKYFHRLISELFNTFQILFKPLDVSYRCCYAGYLVGGEYRVSPSPVGWIRGRDIQNFEPVVLTFDP